MSDEMVTTRDCRSGIDVVRQAMRARHQSSTLSARDAGVPAEMLHRFTYNQGSLPLAAINKLVEHIWGGRAKYDATLDAIVSANETPPLPAPITPPPIDLSKMPTAPVLRESPIHPNYSSPSPPKAKRPGFVTRW